MRSPISSGKKVIWTHLVDVNRRIATDCQSANFYSSRLGQDLPRDFLGSNSWRRRTTGCKLTSLSLHSTRTSGLTDCAHAVRCSFAPAVLLSSTPDSKACPPISRTETRERLETSRVRKRDIYGSAQEKSQEMNLRLSSSDDLDQKVYSQKRRDSSSDEVKSSVGSRH